MTFFSHYIPTDEASGLILTHSHGVFVTGGLSPRDKCHGQVIIVRLERRGHTLSARGNKNKLLRVNLTQKEAAAASALLEV